MGVGVGVRVGVGVGVGRCVAVGVVAVGLGVGRGVGRGVGTTTGRGVGGRGVGGRAVGVTPIVPPVGDGEGSITADGETMGEGEGLGPGENGDGETGDGADVGPTVSNEGGTVEIAVGDAIATSLGAGREAPMPMASAKVASTKLRAPSATTSRARWEDVTSLVPLFPAAQGRLIRDPTDSRW